MSEHLHMPHTPHTCPCARKISDDLKWGKHLGGTHDDHVGLQKMAMHHHAQHDNERMEIRKVEEGKTPAILKKK
jgi:hypothetical protein